MSFGLPGPNYTALVNEGSFRYCTAISQKISVNSNHSWVNTVNKRIWYFKLLFQSIIELRIISRESDVYLISNFAN